MKIYCLSFVVIFCVFCAHAHAKTLIVTHPQEAYDENGSAGLYTTALLQDPQYRERIVLWSREGGAFTFSDDHVAAYSPWPSQGGEITFIPADSHFSLAGGFFEHCLRKTLLDLIKYSKPTKTFYIEVKMNGVYGSDRQTLAKFEALYGARALQAMLSKYAQGMIHLLNKDCEVLFLPNTKNIKVELRLRDQFLHLFGQGTRRVVLDFN